MIGITLPTIASPLAGSIEVRMVYFILNACPFRMWFGGSISMVGSLPISAVTKVISELIQTFFYDALTSIADPYFYGHRKISLLSNRGLCKTLGKLLVDGYK
jgi:hypothetical protein